MLNAPPEFDLGAGVTDSSSVFDPDVFTLFSRRTIS
jgi:hypothetical protein